MHIIRFYILLISIALISADSFQWIKLTPTSNTPSEFPTNITAGVLENNRDTIYLLLGHREIWPPNGSGTMITFSNATYAYDINNNNWSKLSINGSIPLARAYPAGTHVDLSQRIYFYGGVTFDNNYQNLNLFDDFWYFDITTNSFIEIPQTVVWPGPRSSARLFHFENIYIFLEVLNLFYNLLDYLFIQMKSGSLIL